jgi:hypothetical protein
MRTAPLLLLAALVAACIKPIPVPCVDARDCDDTAGGACVASSGAAWCAYADPACPGSQQRYAPDVGDALAGTCVPAVSCEPGDFQACTGDQLTRCNATGTAAETVLCELGCSESLGGCHLCEPSTTACTNGTVATCDAAGRPTATRECPLGCATDEPRCREIVPSNGLGQFLAEADMAPDLVLADRDKLDSTGHVWRDGMRTSTAVPTHLIPAPVNGVAIRVYLVGSVSIGTTELTLLTTNRDQDVPAIAIVSARDIVVRGTINLTGVSLPQPGSKYGTPYLAPGSIARGQPCVGGDPVLAMHVEPGAGGGGNAAAGGDGGRAGTGQGQRSGNRGSMSPVLSTLEPLRGGCAGGYLSDTGGSGGGALQLVSGTRISLGARGAINAGGAGGSTPLSSFGAGGGGGAGGGILLEAPVVELGDGAGLAANGGGGGGAGGNPGASGRVSLDPAPGGVGCTNDDTACSGGGAGATNNVAARGGVAAIPRTGASVQAGGGGGGVGVIRINTKDASYVAAPGVILSPTPTTGALDMR